MLYPQICPYISIRRNLLYSMLHLEIILSTDGCRRLWQYGYITKSKLSYRQVLFSSFLCGEISARNCSIASDYLLIERGRQGLFEPTIQFGSLYQSRISLREKALYLPFSSCPISIGMIDQ